MAAAAKKKRWPALVVTSDRESFQLAAKTVTILTPTRGVSELARIGPDEVRERYDVEPKQVPDFIALRGDPSDGLPGAKGIGEKTARELLGEHETLEALLKLPMGLRPRVRQALEEQAGELRAFREIATLQAAGVEFDREAASSERLARDQGRTGAGEEVEHDVAAAGGVLQLGRDQRHRLHRRVDLAARRPINKEH